MPDTIQHILPYITGMLFLFALLVFLVSARLFRRSRTDVFWRRRRQAGRRGWHLFLAAFGILITSGLSCALTLAVAVAPDQNEPTPARVGITGTAVSFPPTATETAAATPSATLPAVNDTPSRSPTQIPATPTPVVIMITTTPIVVPTVTPFPTFTPNAPPLEANATPRPNARIVITALDDRISDAFAPVNPRTTFSAGTERIYMFVEFRNMAPGVLWTHNLYRDGELVDGNTYLWGLETDGQGYFFFGSDDGFAPGNYEIRLFIGNNTSPINVMPFTIMETG